MGEHTVEILSEQLGLDETVIDGLMERGVVAGLTAKRSVGEPAPKPISPR